MEWRRGDHTISDRQEDLDIDTIHDFLRDTYWARGIPKAAVEKAVRHSLCFGVYVRSAQIGFGRVITDFAAFAYLADVFVLPAYRNRGLGKWLVACILSHPDLQGLRRWMLATKDAHGFYTQQGFTSLKEPGQFMEIHRDRALKTRKGER